jgi:hypothetical protein
MEGNFLSILEIELNTLKTISLENTISAMENGCIALASYFMGVKMKEHAKDGRILIVEDQEKYQLAAKKALAGKCFELVENYDDAISKVELSDIVISDVFFSQSSSGTSQELKSRALSSIKYGMVKDYVASMCDRIKTEANVEPDIRLQKCFEILGYHNLGCNGDSLKHLSDSILVYFKAMGKESTVRLESMLDDMLINNSANRMIKSLFDPLEEYMSNDVSNQPLGYIVAEEAERCKKSFVLVTSLRHAEGSLIPVLRSAKARGWNILEGADGSKDDPKYWKKAYDLVIQK